MARRVLPIVSVALLGVSVALVAVAQAGDPKSGAPAPGATDAAKPAATFPEPVKKKLHAKNDLRGKQAPKLEVEKWLSEQPKIEGKLVLVDFWATWCPPCRRLIPQLEAWQKEFKDDLVVIGISDEPAAKVEAFYKDKPHGYASAIDTKATMKKALGVEGIPHVMIVGTDNIVRWQGFPGSAEEPLTTDTIRRIIDADKARREADKQKTGAKADAKAG